MSDPGRPPAAFPPTRHSLVDLALRGTDEVYREAWSTFLRAYGPPLHAFLVRTGSSAEEALDILQDFFVEGLEGKILRGYDPERGRLRTWLLACLKNVRRKSVRRALARPEGHAFDLPDGAPEPPAPTTEDPELMFEREWSRVLAARTVEAVRDRLRAARDTPSLVLLDRWVLAEERPEVDALAAELGVSTGTLYTRATRLRHALAKEAEAQVCALTTNPRELAAERDAALAHLRTTRP